MFNGCSILYMLSFWKVIEKSEAITIKSELLYLHRFYTEFEMNRNIIKYINVSWYPFLNYSLNDYKLRLYINRQRNDHLFHYAHSLLRTLIATNALTTESSTDRNSPFRVKWRRYISRISADRLTPNGFHFLHSCPIDCNSFSLRVKKALSTTVPNLNVFFILRYFSLM